MKKTFNKIQPIMAFHTKTGLNQYIDKHHKKPPKLFCTYTKTGTGQYCPFYTR